MSWLQHIISSAKVAGLGIWLLQSGCAGDPYADVLNGAIAYPFYEPTRPLGKGKITESDRFVIRTISGGTEYVVEIPGAARDYDVELPMATAMGAAEAGPKVENPQITDRELVAAMPKISKATEQERALMDRAFGAGESGGPTQAPSYSLKVAKINKLYRGAEYELALVEINNMLAFYPTSVRLYKMKGTVLVKLRNFTLAERAWQRAAELAPGDAVIRKGLARLRLRIKRNEAAGVSAAPGASTATAPGQNAGDSPPPPLVTDFRQPALDSNVAPNQPASPTENGLRSANGINPTNSSNAVNSANARNSANTGF